MEVDASDLGPMAGYGPCEYPRGCDDGGVLRVASLLSVRPLVVCAAHGLPLVAMAAERGKLATVTVGADSAELRAAVEVAAWPQWHRVAELRAFVAAGGVLDMETWPYGPQIRAQLRG
jgi:hypothetical protein